MHRLTPDVGGVGVGPPEGGVLGQVVDHREPGGTGVSWPGDIWLSNNILPVKGDVSILNER